MANFKRQATNQSVSNLFFALSKALNNIGVDATIESLNVISNSNKRKKDEHLAEAIVQIVSETLSSQEFSFEKKDRYDGIEQEVACFISFFLKKYAYYNQNEIAEMIGRNKSQVSKYITRISQMKMIGVPMHDHIYELVQECDNKIQMFQRKTKKNK